MGQARARARTGPEESNDRDGGASRASGGSSSGETGHQQEGRGNSFIAERLGLGSSPGESQSALDMAQDILGGPEGGATEGSGWGVGDGEGQDVAPPPADSPGTPDGGGGATPMGGGAGPKITVYNVEPAGGQQARTRVGVGEECQFSFSGDDWGKWTASDGRGSFAKGYFNWTAGDAAGSVTVTGTTKDGKSSTVTMTVVEPSSVTGANASSTGQPSGAAGAGMTLDLIIGPTDVSFRRMSWAEIAGGASNLQGYFVGKSPPSHTPANPSSPGPGNVIKDKASFNWRGGTPWSQGSYDWVIPNKWSVGGSAQKDITTVTQRHEILDATGAGRVTKAGVSSS